MTHLFSRVSVLIASLLFTLCAAADNANPKVKLTTNKGDIVIELYAKRAPKTVENFLSYVDEGYYTDTIFHRVIPNFMIQGGGFTTELSRKRTKAPIINEANAFVPNARGTISMARTNDPHSATSQFFINTVNNKSLNKSSLNPGYAVFGKVLTGMDVVDIISASKTGIQSGMRDVPIHTVVIMKAERISETSAP